MKKRILIVEDDVVTAYAYRNALERAGFLVEVASDGAAGLDYLQRHAPDAVLLDLMLPKVNGVEFLKGLRALQHLSSVPVVVYTNASIPLFIDQAKAAGASVVFSKSDLTPDRLLTALAAMMGS